jgi:hypothetical protein
VPTWHQDIHHFAESCAVSPFLEVNHLMYENVLERRHRLLRKLEIQPDPARCGIATAPPRLHAPDAHLDDIGADLPFPLAEKWRDLLAQPFSIPFVECRFALDAISARPAAHRSNVSSSKRFEDAWRPLVRLKTSVLYRFDALIFHLSLIERREDALFAAIKARPDGMLEQEHVRSLMSDATREMSFLFDDLVFNALSLFDYNGRMITTLQRTESATNRKWLGVVKWARGSATLALRTPEVVLRHNEEWIQGISDFRNRVIHEESDLAGAQWSWNFGAAARPTDPSPGAGEPAAFSLGMHVSAPTGFRECIRTLRDTTVEPVGLLSAGKWIVEQSFDATSELAESLMADLPHAPWLMS